MTPETRRWRDGLLTFLEEDRRRPRHRSTPDPDQAVIDEVERLVAESVRQWAKKSLADQLVARHAWLNSPSGVAGGDPDPAILLTTTPLGLSVAEQTLRDEPGGIICLLEVEYRRFCRLQPDEQLRHHVTAWNWVKTNLPRVRQGDFPAYPLEPGEQYWLHRTGIAGIASEEVRNTALLAFEGTHSRLLAASTVETRFEDEA
jgi:hypothetical protein